MKKITEEFLRNNILYPNTTLAEYPIKGDQMDVFNESDSENIRYFTVIKVDTKGVDVALSIIGVKTGRLEKRVTKEELLNGKWWRNG